MLFGFNHRFSKVLKTDQMWKSAPGTIEYINVCPAKLVVEIVSYSFIMNSINLVLFHQLYSLSYCKKGCFHHLNLLYQQQHQLIQTHHIRIQSYQILVYFHPHLLNLSPRLNQVSLSPGQCTHLEIYLIQQDNESILFHAYQSAQVIVSEDKS